MARGVLVPIDDWIAGSEIIEKELYLEGWNDGFYQGTMYGVPPGGLPPLRPQLSTSAWLKRPA